MAHLLYYAPGETLVDTERTRKLGLFTSIGQCGFSRRPVTSGPDGGPGVVFIAYEPDSTIDVKYGFYPDSQVWQECNEGKFWIGHEKGECFTPDDFARPRQMTGHPLKLRDGNEWIIPAISLFGGASALPGGMALDAKGEIVFEDLPEYADLREGAQHIYEWVFSGDPDKKLLLSEGLRYASRALSLNYRIDRWETSVLKLWTTDNVTEACQLMIDLPAYIEMATSMDEDSKKNDEDSTGDSPSTDSGSAA